RPAGATRRANKVRCPLFGLAPLPTPAITGVGFRLVMQLKSGILPDGFSPIVALGSRPTGLGPFPAHSRLLAQTAGSALPDLRREQRLRACGARPYLFSRTRISAAISWLK